MNTVKKVISKIIQWPYFPLVIIEVVLFFLYFNTLAPGYTWSHEGWDAGDLLASIKVMGLAHPPGTPLYLMVGKLFSYLPIGNFAYRLNFMSLFWALCGLLFLYRSVYVLTRNRTAAALATFITGTAKILWEQAVITEVNTFTFFFGMVLISTLLNLLTCITKDLPISKAGWKKITLLFFILGLSLTNHLLPLLLVPGIVFSLILKRGRLMRVTSNSIKRVLVITAAFIIGLTPYLYVPLRALANPILNWGDPSSFSRLISYASASQYHEQFTEVSAYFLDGFVRYAELLIKSIGLIPAMVAIFGLFALWKKRAFPELIFITCSMGAYILFIFHYVEAMTNSYSLILIGLTALLLAVGYDYLVKHIQYRSAGLTLGLLFAGYAMAHTYALYPTIDLSHDYGPDIYTHEALKDIEQDAIVLASSDHLIFALYYSRYILYPERNDIKLMVSGIYYDKLTFGQSKDAFPDLVFPESEFGKTDAIADEGLLRFVDANSHTHAIYTTLDYPPPALGSYDEKIFRDRLLEQKGVLYHFADIKN